MMPCIGLSGLELQAAVAPAFVTKLAPEDRCHLNGLAMDKGRPRHVTMVSERQVGVVVSMSSASDRKLAPIQFIPRRCGGLVE